MSVGSVRTGAGLPSKSKTAGRGGVRISIVVEEGQVEYVVSKEPTASSSHSVKSPVTGSKRKESASSGPTSRKQYDVGSPVTSPRKSYKDDPTFGAAFNRAASGSGHGSGRDRRAFLFAFSVKK